MRSLVTSVTRLATGDPLMHFELLRRIARWVLPIYRFKWPQMAWWDDPTFNAYLDRFGERQGANTDRRWMLYQLMRLTSGVPGDTAECGVFQGAGSFLICLVNSQSPAQSRSHFVFDSFEGLSAPTARDGKHWTKGDLACGEEAVAAVLASFPRVHLLKGWIPERFSEIEGRTFAFVHVDVDLYEPTVDSMKFFYPRLNPGGILLCDDYGFTTCPGATRALDEFLRDKPEKMIALSGGGGFLIKGLTTATPLTPSVLL